MRKLITVILVAVTMAMAGTAQANEGKRSAAAELKFQKQRYYHALGYYKTIWNVAGRTVYHPNPRISKKWWGAVKYLKRVQVNSLNEIQRLTTPKSPYPSHYPPHYAQWLCIHRYEGSWTANTGNGYYGGLQMDYSFMGAYGGKLLSSKGTADHWTPLEQMWVAENAWQSRGFWPWPNTARFCGLL